jgi:tRNA acetyltransferase TAN1
LNTQRVLVIRRGVLRVSAFNLLVSFHHHARSAAEEEVRERLKEAGASVGRLEQWSDEGVFLVEVTGDPRRAVADVRKICTDQPELFQHTHHWVPIEIWVSSSPGEMVEAVKELGRGIGPNDKWMLRLHKRHCKEHDLDLIKLLTDPIEIGVVSLLAPEKVLAVEIMGEKAGLALLGKKEILDVNRAKEEIGLTMFA